jgi:hypothetical protein
MTIISNSFAPACGHLLSKYTISTLQSVDIADNQYSCGYIYMEIYQILPNRMVVIARCNIVCSSNLSVSYIHIIGL